MLDSKTDQKRNLKAFKKHVKSNLNLEAPPGGPRRERTHPRDANEAQIWPGGRLQRGVPGLRTSEFWIPDLGDLKAMDLDTLEDNSLVATNPAPQQPGGPEGAGG